MKVQVEWKKGDVPEEESVPEDEEDEEVSGPNTEEKSLVAPVAIIREVGKMSPVSQLGFGEGASPAATGRS